MGDYSLYRGRGVDGELRGPDGIANAILSARRYPGNKHLTFLLVEGEGDKHLYENCTDQKRCAIRSIGVKPSAKSVALKVLAILEQNQMMGVLAIVDADFDVLERMQYLSPNVFLTDVHDAELMIVQSPAFEKVLREHGSEHKIAEIEQRAGKDLRALLLEGSQVFGYIRWVSLKKGYALKFDKLEPHKCFDRRTLTIDKAKTLDHIRNKSQQPNISAEQIQMDIAEIQSDEHDLWHVCCGHDLTNVLTWGLREGLHKNNHYEVTQLHLEASLRMSYEYAYFKKTRLYAALQAWEEANQPFVILRQEID